jgi:hypothetical protein
MTKPFENTPEPRFTNAYIFDTPKKMFSRGADVNTYGIYSNIAPPLAVGPFETGLVFPWGYKSAFAGSNIGTLDVFSGARCLAITSSINIGAGFLVPILTVINLSNHSIITSLSYPATSYGLATAGNDRTTTFIYGNKLFAQTTNSALTKNDLYVLNSSMSWDLVATDVTPATGFPTDATGGVGADSLSDSLWWGIKRDAYVNSTTARNPRLVVMSTAGVITEYAGTAADFPTTLQTGQTVPTFTSTVTDSRIFAATAERPGYLPTIRSWDISTGSPVYSGVQTIAASNRVTERKFIGNDGFVGFAGTYSNAFSGWEKAKYVGGTHTFTANTGAAYGDPWDTGTNLANASNTFSETPRELNITGWSRDASRDGTIGAYIRFEQATAPFTYIYSGGIYRFNADSTSELVVPITSIPSNSATRFPAGFLSLDQSNDRVYYIEGNQTFNDFNYPLKYFVIP